MQITISEKRTAPQSIRLSDNTTLASAGAIHIKFGNSHLLPSGFCMQSGDRVLYIDPVRMDIAKPADYILITHAHPDHFSLDDINRLATPDTIIVGPRSVAKKLKPRAVITVSPNDVVDLDGIRCEAVPAYSLGFPSHPKRQGNVGYVLDIDRIRVYHSGDTDYVPELNALKDIDVALVAIDGGSLTMSTPDAARLINNMRPKTVVPMHYVVQQNKTDAFRKLIDDPIDVIVLAD